MTERAPGVVYHSGGFDPDAPQNNAAEVVTDNGDGTGTLTFYDVDGNQTGTEQVDLPPGPEPTVEEQLAAVTAALEALAGGGE